jgi:hypothetical protein
MLDLITAELVKQAYELNSDDGHNECWMVKNMKYHFYGNTTDLYTNVLERTPVIYNREQLSIRILQRQ